MPKMKKKRANRSTNHEIENTTKKDVIWEPKWGQKGSPGRAKTSRDHLLKGRFSQLSSQACFLINFGSILIHFRNILLLFPRHVRRHCSSKQQTANSKQQATSSKQQAASSNQQAATSKQQASSKTASSERETNTTEPLQRTPK